jgi:hypothetical protein
VPKPATVYIPEAIAEATVHVLASYGSAEQPHEGIAYWAGISADDAWVVTTVLAPQAHTTPGSFNTSAQANAQVVGEVNKLRLQILGQVHGHPGELVGHSHGDDLGAFMPYAGSLSLIAPFYGRQGILPLSHCGVHRYLDGDFVQLTEQEIEQQFVVLPAAIDLRKDQEMSKPKSQ